MRLLSPLFTVLGLALQVLATCALLTSLVGGVNHTGNLKAFLLSALLYFVAGLICVGLGRAFQTRHFSTRQMFLTTAGTWFFLCLLGSLPLQLASTHLTTVDALFETISGLTTTGSTILSDLSHIPADILLWRSLLQWVGGIGVICMAVLLLPFLKVGGMRLFQTESSHWEDRGNIPRTKDLVNGILQTYSLLTLACFIAYLIGGMNLFDAFNHALTTLSTGGYSTTDRSFSDASYLLQWIATVFMIAGAIPFTLYPTLTKRHNGNLFKDSQVRGLLIILVVFIALLSIDMIGIGETGFFDALTRSAFNITSVVTTTGFASGDYSLWGNFAVAIFFFATFIGGCSSSTSGGTKIFRIQLFFKLIKSQLARTIHPKVIVSTTYAGKPVNSEIVTALVAYFFFMVSSLLIITLALSATNLDLVTSISGAATALMNVGPGLGEVIGPAGNFSSLTDTAKLLLCAGMLLGRLEFLTIIILFTASYWRG